MFLLSSGPPAGPEYEDKPGPGKEHPGTKTDPEGAVQPGSGGDAFIIAAGVIGAVAVAAVGFVVSWGIGGLFITILCSVGGALVGGTVGAWLGERVERRVRGRSRGRDPNKSE